MEYYILSLKWSKNKGRYLWWGTDDSGYTEDLNQAGVYSESRILSKRNYYQNTNTYPVPVDLVNTLKTQRVVPSNSENWNILNIDLTTLKEY